MSLHTFGVLSIQQDDDHKEAYRLLHQELTKPEEHGGSEGTSVNQKFVIRRSICSRVNDYHHCESFLTNQIDLIEKSTRSMEVKINLLNRL